jgi:hypothetical protein
MQADFYGRVLSTPAAVTLLVNGVEVHSGQVGAGMPLDSQLVLASYEWASNAKAGDTVTVNMSVTTGVLTVGSVIMENGATDQRKNILINGQPPEEPASSVGQVPADNWAGWFFEVSAGETITFNLEYPAIL